MNSELLLLQLLQGVCSLPLVLSTYDVLKTVHHSDKTYSFLACGEISANDDITSGTRYMTQALPPQHRQLFLFNRSYCVENLRLDRL